MCDTVMVLVWSPYLLGSSVLFGGNSCDREIESCSSSARRTSFQFHSRVGGVVKPS
jgi:hypothetical protein